MQVIGVTPTVPQISLKGAKQRREGVLWNPMKWWWCWWYWCWWWGSPGKGGKGSEADPPEKLPFLHSIIIWPTSKDK